MVVVVVVVGDVDCNEDEDVRSVGHADAVCKRSSLTCCELYVSDLDLIQQFGDL